MIGIQVKKLRKYYKFSQKEFGAMIGKSINTIMYWEKGKVKPPETAIDMLIHTFGINRTWLFTGEGEMWLKGITDQTNNNDKFDIENNINDIESELKEVFQLLRTYASVKYIRKIKDDLLEIKRITEMDSE